MARRIPHRRVPGSRLHRNGSVGPLVRSAAGAPLNTYVGSACRGISLDRIRQRRETVQDDGTWERAADIARFGRRDCGRVQSGHARYI